MAVHDVQVAPLLFRCISDGTWQELVIPQKGEAIVQGDLACFREFNDDAARYTNTPPITYKIVKVASHYSDMTRIPFGCVLISFEKIPPTHNAPVHEFIPVAKVARNAIPATPRPPTRWPF
jgi:hypothetical protein